MQAGLTSDARVLCKWLQNQSLSYQYVYEGTCSFYRVVKYYVVKYYVAYAEQASSR